MNKEFFYVKEFPKSCADCGFSAKTYHKDDIAHTGSYRCKRINQVNNYGGTSRILWDCPLRIGKQKVEISEELKNFYGKAAEFLEDNIFVQNTIDIYYKDIQQLEEKINEYRKQQKTIKCLIKLLVELRDSRRVD